MLRTCIVLCAVLVATTTTAGAQKSSDDLVKRQAYLDELIELFEQGDWPQDRTPVTPLDATWLDWIERTGELPPDFDALPSVPSLPDPLVLDEGGRNVPITTLEQWQEKRAWIADQVTGWITGTFPPPPGNMEAEIVREDRSGDILSRVVDLRFGPDRQAALRLELLIPPGPGPLPVFMTQWNHRGWAVVAARRGYIGCVYAGADARDDTEAYANIWYPEYDFTRLMRRAWGAHRAVDYLYTLPFVDKHRIGLTGHSRNGKQSLMAAAFDDRIDAVVSSSGGTGGENPFRYTSEKYDNESIEEITSKFVHWLHPRLRFFAGREHKLPVDQNLLMALIAPRGLMLSSAMTEHQGNPWGIQQAYESVREVYDFLGAAERLGLRLRHGLHGTAARDIEAYVDFFDVVFGRQEGPPEVTPYHPYSFDAWRIGSGEVIDPSRFPERGIDELTGGGRIETPATWAKERAEILEKLRWSLGDEPPGARNPGPGRVDERRSDDYLGEVIGRPSSNETVARAVVRPYRSFGDYLYGSLYYPRDAVESGERVPVVVYLHEYDYSNGFARRIGEFIEGAVNRGYAVFAYDQIGFGTRIEEGTHFYDRYPSWSKLGKMIADLEGAVDMLLGLELADPDRIYVFGYALGGVVGLYGAALDERIAGAASVAGFTPLRTAGPSSGLEGIRTYSHLHGLQPRLGFFVGEEARLPFDFHEIMAAIAPRPLLVLAPQRDRDARHEHVVTAVARARDVYRIFGEERQLRFLEPVDFNRFTELRQADVLSWLESLHELSDANGHK